MSICRQALTLNILWCSMIAAPVVGAAPSVGASASPPFQGTSPAHQGGHDGGRAAPANSAVAAAGRHGRVRPLDVASGLQFNGSATGGLGFVRLTQPPAQSQAGSAFYSTPVDVTGAFHSQLQFNLHDSTTFPPPSNLVYADGIALSIQDSSAGPSALGGAGGGLGYSGIVPSINFEFDTYNNPGDWLGSGEEVGITYNTSLTNYCSGAAAPVELYGNGPVSAWVDYDPAVPLLKLYVSQGGKPSSPTVTCSVNVATKLQSSTAYIGVTGGTGTFNSAQDVLSWQWQGTGGNLALVSPPHPGQAELTSPSEPCTCHNTGKPVNTADGSFWHTFGDIGISGRGIPLALTRTYRSPNASQDGPFGYGWSDSYAMYLTQDPSGAVTVHEEGGTAVTFTPSGSSYTAPGRVLATLQANVDGANTLTFRRKNREKFVFGAPTQSVPGHLQQEVDNTGTYHTTLSYDSSGRLQTVQDPEGRTLTVAYGLSGVNANHVSSVTDSTGRKAQYAYDGNGNLTDVSDVGRADTGQGHWIFTYDGNHLLLTMQDPDGHVTSNTYDSANRVHLQTATMTGGNRTTQFDYATNPDGTTQTTITGPNGNKTVDVYNNFELTSETQGYGTAQAATWQYTYDPYTSEITSVTDPRNHTWTYTWDGYGNLLRSVGPATSDSTTSSETTTYSYTYDPSSDLFFTKVVVTDPTNVATTYSYDGSGDLLSVARPLTSTGQTATTTFTYGDTAHPSDVTRVSDPNGHATTVVYDSTGNVSQVTDATGDIARYGYDALGRVTSAISPNGNVTGANSALSTTTASYDTMGDLTQVSDPLGNVTAYHYDADGNLVRTVDARGNATISSYDEENEPTSVAAYSGDPVASPSTATEQAVQGATYDGDGNVLARQMIAANGTTVVRTLGYTYDALDRVQSATDTNGKQTTYTYDGTGNVTQVTDPALRTTTLTYDELNQRTTVSYTDGTPNPTYAYTANGLLRRMTDGTGTSTFTYDSLNRLTKHVNGASQEVDYGYCYVPQYDYRKPVDLRLLCSCTQALVLTAHGL